MKRAQKHRICDFPDLSWLSVPWLRYSSGSQRKTEERSHSLLTVRIRHCVRGVPRRGPSLGLHITWGDLFGAFLDVPMNPSPKLSMNGAAPIVVATHAVLRAEHFGVVEGVLVGVL